MAVKYENECVSCGVQPCLGNHCPNTNVPHCFCDKCKREFESVELYVTEDDEELCEECLLLRYETVAQREEKER